MYSKHSAVGSRILGIIQNNDVVPSSPAFPLVLKQQPKMVVACGKRKGLGTTSGKISCKENYSGIFQNLFLFWNRVNQMHPRILVL